MAVWRHSRNVLRMRRGPGREGFSAQFVCGDIHSWGSAYPVPVVCAQDALFSLPAPYAVHAARASSSRSA